MEPESSILALVILSATIGVTHTLLGPDHYLPFIALARAGRWTSRKTVTVASLCGVGHVLGSVLLGTAGAALLTRVDALVGIEDARGQIAAWLLCGFGLVYTVWGLRRGIRNRPHTHVHVHADGTIHAHPHTHDGEHMHVHSNVVEEAPPSRMRVAPWVLFIVFLFGPCEPLIPILMYPALRHGWMPMMLVAGVFALATVLTMTLVVLAGIRVYPANSNRMGPLSRFVSRFGHALAGSAVTACGIAMLAGW